MKKIYSAPTVVMTEIELQSMIAASTDTPLNVDSANSFSSTGAETDALSRRSSSVWGDDEGEEF